MQGIVSTALFIPAFEQTAWPLQPGQTNVGLNDGFCDRRSNTFQVITDPLTSRSKGYGFVRFGSEAERDRALGDMSGHFISNRPIRVSLATAKKSASLQVSGFIC